MYSSIESISVATAAAGTAGMRGGPGTSGRPWTPLFTTFFCPHASSKSGIHLGSFLRFWRIHPCHLLAVTSETRPSGSFLSAMLNGFNTPTLALLVAMVIQWL